MPKLNIDIDLEGAGTAEGFEAYSGPLPRTGSYHGKLKICQMAVTSERAKNPGAQMLKIGVELTDAEPKEAIGYVAFRNLVLIDSVATFINQFLRSLTDGSDQELAKMQKAFKREMVLADDKRNIIRIGSLKVNSPQGEIPVKVAVKQRTFTTIDGESRTTCGIDAFLLSDGGRAKLSAVEDEVVEEDTDDDESVFDLDDDA